MKINKTVPYFIEEVCNDDEFINLQKSNFSKGYRWVNGTDIDKSFVGFQNIIDYPFCVSNLPYYEHCDYINKIRESHMQYDNNILYIGDKEEFNLTLMRYEKLKKLEDAI